MNKKAQSTIEYATLIAIIIISLITMAGYFQRAVSARLENVRQDLNNSVK